MTISPILDGESGASVRGKLNAAIGEANSFTAAFGAAYFVSPAGNDSNSGTGPGPESAWQTSSKVNSFPFVGGETIRFESDKIFGALSLAAATGAVTVDIFGGSEPAILGGMQDITNAAWTDNGGSLPGTWTTQITSASRPSRCVFQGAWSDGRGLYRAADQASVSIDAKGVTGNWTNIRQKLWQRAALAGWTSGYVPAWHSVNGGTPKQGSMWHLDPQSEGDGYANGFNFTLFNNAGNPADTLSTLRVSAGWFASTVSGTTRLVTVFSPTGNPSTIFNRILIGGNNSSQALQISRSGHTYRNIIFAGANHGFETNENVQNITFENCQFKWNNEKGGNIEHGCDNWRIIGDQPSSVDSRGVPIFKSRFSENGLPVTEGNLGLKPGGSATTAEVRNLLIEYTEFAYNGEDGFSPQCRDISITMIGCRGEQNGENPIDMKGFYDMNMNGCVWIGGLQATGAGTGGPTVQGRGIYRAVQCIFIGTNGFTPATISSFQPGLRSSAEASFDLDRVIIFGDHLDDNRFGLAADGGPKNQPIVTHKARNCLVVGARATTNTIAFALENGSVELKHCTIAHKNAGTNAKTLRQDPGASATVQAVTVQNSILYGDGASTSAYLFMRNVAGVNGITSRLTDNIYFQKANPTNWMFGGDAGNYTEAQIDAGIDQGPGIFVVSDFTITDPTADPMFDNPMEGGEKPCTSDLRGVGNWKIGGTLIHLTCSAISAGVDAPTLGERVTNGTGSGYVRDIFANGLLLSSVTGTFTTGALNGQWGSVVATVSVVSAALTLKAGVWDAQTVNFSTLGQVVGPGSISGHSGILVSQVDAGSTGRMVLAVASGITFADNDVVPGASEGSVTLNGPLQSSPARKACRYIYPLLAYGAPENLSYPIDLGSPREYVMITHTSSNTLTVVNAARTWTKSAASPTWEALGLRVGVRFWTNIFDATIDAGGPYTVQSIDSTTQFTTIESPGANAGPSSTANLSMAGDVDAGCYPIP